MQHTVLSWNGFLGALHQWDIFESVHVKDYYIKPLKYENCCRFCAEHSRKANLLRQKALTKQAPPQTQESLLASLAHYVQNKDQPGVVKKEENENEDSASKVSSYTVNPFGNSFINIGNSKYY